MMFENAKAVGTPTVVSVGATPSPKISYDPGAPKREPATRDNRLLPISRAHIRSCRASAIYIRLAIESYASAAGRFSAAVPNAATSPVSGGSGDIDPVIPAATSIVLPLI